MGEWSTKNLIIKKNKKDMLKWVTKYTIPQDLEILLQYPHINPSSARSHNPKPVSLVI